MARNGILAPERFPKPIVTVEPIGDGEQTADGCDVHLALGHRIEPARIRESVEIESAVVAVAPDLAQELKRLAQVHRSYHEPHHRAWRSHH